ncbi:hypothetical protein DFH09DRAFT_1284343 [Mycena vulgaris]|nr:hypothetical protein DFH09DRAFT_1284343 [Mycena vulgaris]
MCISNALLYCAVELEIYSAKEGSAVEPLDQLRCEVLAITAWGGQRTAGLTPWRDLVTLGQSDRGKKKRERAMAEIEWALGEMSQGSRSSDKTSFSRFICARCSREREFAPVEGLAGMARDDVAKDSRLGGDRQRMADECSGAKILVRGCKERDVVANVVAKLLSNTVWGIESVGRSRVQFNAIQRQRIPSTTHQPEPPPFDESSGSELLCVGACGPTWLVPSSLDFACDMVTTLFILLAFCVRGRAALINRTIEDSSPLVQYNCTIKRCDADATHSNPCSIVGAEFRTFTAFFTPCQITISFTGRILVNFPIILGPDLHQGTAIYSFLGCKSTSNCEFEIDNTGKHPNIRPAEQVPITGLSYVNESLPNGTHTLVMTSSNGFVAFDYVTYTDGEVFTLTQTESAQIPTKSTSSPPVVIHEKSKPWIGGIVGGVLGGMVLMAVLAALVVFLKLCSGRRKKTPGRILMAAPYPPSEVNTAGSPQAEDIALTEQINLLQERQVALRAQRATKQMSATDLLMPTVRHAPAVPAPLVHTDSGLRLAPARSGGAAAAVFSGLIHGYILYGLEVPRFVLRLNQ